MLSSSVKFWSNHLLYRLESSYLNDEIYSGHSSIHQHQEHYVIILVLVWWKPKLEEIKGEGNGEWMRLLSREKGRKERRERETFLLKLTIIYFFKHKRKIRLKKMKKWKPMMKLWTKTRSVLGPSHNHELEPLLEKDLQKLGAISYFFI